MVLEDKEFDKKIDELKANIQGFEKIDYGVDDKELERLKNQQKEEQKEEKPKEKKSKLKRILQVTSIIPLVYGLIKKFGKAAANRLIKPLIKGAYKIATKLVTPVLKGIYKITLKPIGKLATKLLPKTAGKIATKEGGKIAGKVVGKVALKEGGKVAVKEAAKVATKLPLTKPLVEKIGAKTLEKTGSKLLGKGIGAIFKKIPVVGLLVGAGFAVNRALKGDYTGAGLELASGALACVPVIGTGASIGMDAAIIGRDIAQGR